MRYQKLPHLTWKLLLKRTIDPIYYSKHSCIAL